jgi:hypothetical protein
LPARGYRQQDERRPPPLRLGGNFSLALDGEKARRYFESKPPADRHSCSMCGKMCAMRTTNRFLKEKKCCQPEQTDIKEDVNLNAITGKVADLTHRYGKRCRWCTR